MRRVTEAGLRLRHAANSPALVHGGRNDPYGHRPHTLQSLGSAIFGFPKPMRLPSVTARSPTSRSQAHLIGPGDCPRARAGDVVPLREGRLKHFSAGRKPGPADACLGVQLLEKVPTFDREEIVSDLSQAYASLASGRFFARGCAPHIPQSATAWERASLRSSTSFSRRSSRTPSGPRTPLEHGGRRAGDVRHLPGRRANRWGCSGPLARLSPAGRPNPRRRIPATRYGPRTHLDPLRLGHLGDRPHRFAATARRVGRLRRLLAPHPRCCRVRGRSPFRASMRRSADHAQDLEARTEASRGPRRTV